MIPECRRYRCIFAKSLILPRQSVAGATMCPPERQSVAEHRIIYRNHVILGITARAALAREHPPTREAPQRRGGAPDEQRSPEEKGALQIYSTTLCLI